MNIQDYQKAAISTLTSDHDYGELSPQLLAQVLGLVGESGEVAEKFKKILRDSKGQLSEADKLKLVQELGDVLWYVTSISHLIGYDLEAVAKENNRKLASRRDRNVIKGSGDDR